MTQYGAIKVFEHKRIRSSWDAETETWYYSIVDVVGILTDQPDTRHASNYWKVLKNRLAVTIWRTLSMTFAMSGCPPLNIVAAISRSPM